jgi:hypothetical protein
MNGSELGQGIFGSKFKPTATGSELAKTMRVTCPRRARLLATLRAQAVFSST